MEAWRNPPLGHGGLCKASAHPTRPKQKRSLQQNTHETARAWDDDAANHPRLPISSRARRRRRPASHTSRNCVAGDSTMAQDFINNLVEKSGISADQAKQGLGAVLGFLKEKLPADTFSKVSTAVPGADRMMSAAETAPEDSGGIVSKVTGAIGKLFGGSAAEMVSKLTNSGLS